MKRYDPAIAPNPAEWLALDESDRIDLVEEYHRRVRTRLPNLTLHAVVHTIVENQIAMGDELPARQAMERLMREGLDRHDALHAIGSEAIGYMTELLRTADAGPVSKAGESAESAAMARFKVALERLTASRWRASADADDAAPPRNIESVIVDLKVSRDLLPVDSMQWCLDHWDEAAPRLLAMLKDYASGDDRSEDTANALFLGIHLLGEKRESRAFPALCQLLSHPTDAVELLGDEITENLRGILISLFDGDRLALRRLIEAPEVEPFVRYAVLEAMAYLTRTGRIPEDETRAFLGHLREAMQPRDESPVWDAWAAAVANLGYAEFAQDVEALIGLGYLDPLMTEPAWFHERLRLVLDSTDGLAGFEEDGIGPFEGAIETLAAWDGFADEDDFAADEEDFASPLSAWPGPSTTHVNPLRNVGRNDPCPCGSGKKYKKCCLR